MIDSQPLPYNGGYVIAVNVEPYAAPPVGVAAPGKGGGETLWSFPVRRGRGAKHLRPEELATIMDPQFRRMVLLLERIPVYSTNDYPSATFHFQDLVGFSGETIALDLVKVDADNAVVLLRDFQSKRRVEVPIDEIRSVWKETTPHNQPGHFNIAVRGRLSNTNHSLVYSVH